MRRALPVLLLVLALPATAHGGGFATVGLAPPPASVGPGDTWTAELTILAHGRTPVDGLEPTVAIRSGDDVRSFPARPAGRPGVYRAEVVFGDRATWTYEVGAFGRTHTFAPVTLRGAPPAPATSRAAAPADGAGVLGPLGIALAAGLLAALATAALQRRRPAPA